MEDNKNLLKSFVEWLSEKEDVFFAFDDPDKAISQFLYELKNKAL